MPGAKLGAAFGELVTKSNSLNVAERLEHQSRFRRSLGRQIVQQCSLTASVNVERLGMAATRFQMQHELTIDHFRRAISLQALMVKRSHIPGAIDRPH